MFEFKRQDVLLKVFDAASDKQIVDFAKLARTTSADHLTLDHLTQALITSDIVDNIEQYSFVELFNSIQFNSVQVNSTSSILEVPGLQSKADVSRHIHVCQISFQTQVCAFQSDEDNSLHYDNVFSNSENSRNTDSSDSCRI